MELKGNLCQYFDETSTQGKSAEQSIKSLVEASRIVFGSIVPQPDTVVKVCQSGYKDVDIFTKGSISTIIGKAKSGKTAFTSLIVTAVLKGLVNGEFTRLKSPKNGKVLVFDTEQGEFYASLNVNKIGHQAREHIDNLYYYDLRSHAPNIRLQMIQYAMEEHKSNIDYVLIDGVRDVMYDINSSEEATKTVTELMALSVKYKTHISMILHQNKGDNNARGHIGTECVNKSEIVISVEKTSDGSVVSPEYCRGIEFQPFKVQRNEEGTPFIDSGSVYKSDGKVKKKLEYDDIPHESHIAVLAKVFEKEQAIGYTALFKAIKAEMALIGNKIGDNISKDFLSIYQAKGLIENRSRKYYLLDEQFTKPY